MFSSRSLPSKNFFPIFTLIISTSEFSDSEAETEKMSVRSVGNGFVTGNLPPVHLLRNPLLWVRVKLRLDTIAKMTPTTEWEIGQILEELDESWISSNLTPETTILRRELLERFSQLVL